MHKHVRLYGDLMSKYGGMISQSLGPIHQELVELGFGEQGGGGCVSTGERNIIRAGLSKLPVSTIVEGMGRKFEPK
jgi:hypothetical protein